MDVAGAVSEAIDARMPDNAGRTDLGEMVQAAASEAIVQVVTERTRSLFGSTPANVKAGLATVKQFGEFARRFFGRLTEKVLQYYVSRTTADHVGACLRFPTLAAKEGFDLALALHCHEASKIVQRFAGEWFSKTNWEKDGVSRQDVRVRARRHAQDGGRAEGGCEMKTGTRTVLCGEAAADKVGGKDNVLLLRTADPGRNVHLQIDDISRSVFAEVPPQFADLVEVATYVYVADQVHTRGGAGVEGMGENWRRSLHFEIPVRRPELWGRPGVADALVDVLSFLSEDEYTFVFRPYRKPPAAETYFNFAPSEGGTKPERVVASPAAWTRSAGRYGRSCSRAGP